MNAEFHAALQRPPDHEEKSPEEQWAVDKGLGILDWDGKCDHNIYIERCRECFERYKNRGKAKT